MQSKYAHFEKRLPVTVLSGFLGAAKWFGAVPLEQWPEDPESIEIALSNWREPYGDRRQEIVIIGIAAEMDREFVIECLNSCLLDEAEMAGGPNKWSTLPYPFPAWHPQDEVKPHIVESD